MDKTLGTRPDDQPVNFERPPVHEVYISVQSKESVFPGSDFGALVSVFGVQYPKLNTHPKLERMREFPPGAGMAIQLEMLSELGQRFWLISPDETRVLQVQDDRLTLNWRLRDGGEYPRYRSIRSEFEEALMKLLTARGIDGDDLVDLCEVSYINHIELPDGADPRRQVERAFRNMQRVDIDVEGLSLEEVQFRMSYAVVDSEGEFQGRMRVSAIPAVLTKERRPILQVHLAFRGKPSAPDVRSALDFCDRGHIAIVTTFERITTPEMHALWGKQ